MINKNKKYLIKKEKEIIILPSLGQDISKRDKKETNTYKEEIEELKNLLEQKNLALAELLYQMELAKTKIKEDMASYINEHIIPILKKIKLKETSNKYLDLLQSHLEKLSSSYNKKINHININLSPREMEIVGMLKGGLSSKEISKLLNISNKTIDRHRRNIRKKLGISNKKINLSSYLTEF